MEIASKHLHQNERRFTSPHLSCVICHMSHITCQMSHFLYYWQSREASRWRVCYQRGLPRLVISMFILIPTGWPGECPGGGRDGTGSCPISRMTHWTGSWLSLAVIGCHWLMLKCQQLSLVIYQRSKGYVFNILPYICTIRIHVIITQLNIMVEFISICFSD